MAQVNKTKAYLALASGRVFSGYLFGAQPDEKKGGEVVFNTSLTGYQEILTDPSYQGQIVVMTPSHIGNTGINKNDVESRKIFLSGFIVQEVSGIVSNWRSEETLDAYLKRWNIPGLTGVDTRALTRYLRSQGAVNAIISTDGRDLDALMKKAKALPSMEGQDLVNGVTNGKSYIWHEGTPSWYPKQAPLGEFKNKKRVVVIDYGVKQNILRCLVDRGCDVTVVPAAATADEVLSHKPDGIVLSNGPGDPAVVSYAISTIKNLITHNQKAQAAKDKEVPVFGICLGHQLLGLALGGETYKLKFGHHGGNHPIKDLETGRVDITSQNHGFCVAGEKTVSGEWIVKGNPNAIVTHINLNDNAIEGLRHKTLPMFSVQYHPEASAGPHDASHLFDRFLKLLTASSSNVSVEDPVS